MLKRMKKKHQQSNNKHDQQQQQQQQQESSVVESPTHTDRSLLLLLLLFFFWFFVWSLCSRCRAYAHGISIRYISMCLRDLDIAYVTDTCIGNSLSQCVRYCALAIVIVVCLFNSLLFFFFIFIMCALFHFVHIRLCVWPMCICDILFLFSFRLSAFLHLVCSRMR